jgi:phosphomannomutase/phosphoglucomutase
MLYFAVIHLATSGGVNVTGSHNPIGYNGFKLTKLLAEPIAGAEIQELRQLIESQDFEKGDGSQERADVFQDYVAALKSQVSGRSSAKVVVDAGNGTAGPFSPLVLRELGCDVIELYCEPDGRFPNHLPDPSEEKNVAELRETVVRSGAAAGFALDGDGDRLGLIDETGTRREGDLILALLAQPFLQKNPGAEVLVDIKSSQVVIDNIREHGGVPIVTKTGHSLIKKRMVKEGVRLGGEVSGHLFFRQGEAVYDDATLAACLVADLVSSSGRNLSSYFAEMPLVHSTPELKVPCPDDVKFGIVDEVSKHFIASNPDSLVLDGIRIVFEDGWALVRASNTNPYLTLRFEAATAERLEQIKQIVVKKLREYPDVTIDGVLE